MPRYGRDADELAARLDELLLCAAADDVAALLNDLGAIAALCGDLASAEVHLRSAALLDPSRPQIRRNLDEVLAASGPLAAALSRRGDPLG